MAARTVCVTRCCGCCGLRDAALIIGLSLQVFHLLYLAAVCGWAAGLLPRPPEADRLLALLTSGRAVSVPICSLLADTALMVGVLAGLRALLACWLAWYCCLLLAGCAAAVLLLVDASRFPEAGHLLAILGFLAALLLLAYWWLVVLSLLCSLRHQRHLLAAADTVSTVSAAVARQKPAAVVAVPLPSQPAPVALPVEQRRWTASQSPFPSVTAAPRTDNGEQSLV